ncbi:MAG: hypothetical protein WCX74_04155 [Candidatus Paceibacterota bacterium]
MKKIVLLILLLLASTIAFAEQTVPAESWKEGAINWAIYPPNDGYILLTAEGKNFELSLKVEQVFFVKNREQIIADLTKTLTGEVSEQAMIAIKKIRSQ